MSGSRGLVANASKNGTVDRIADGRSSNLQDHADRMYARRALGLGNKG